MAPGFGALVVVANVSVVLSVSRSDGPLFKFPDDFAPVPCLFKELIAVVRGHLLKGGLDGGLVVTEVSCELNEVLVDVSSQFISQTSGVPC